MRCAMCLRNRVGFTLGDAISFEKTIEAAQQMRNNASDVQLDSIDRAILDVLQHEGRISNQELAQRVHLSPSACLRRVKALEDSGVIGQYVALLNAKAVGKHGISYTILNLESMSTPLLEAFEQELDLTSHQTVKIKHKFAQRS